jgi:hypothetical protein
MPLPFFLAALFGKAAVGVVTKGLASKAAAAGTKAVCGHHGHHALARTVAVKVAEKAIDSAMDTALSRTRKKSKARITIESQ